MVLGEAGIQAVEGTSNFHSSYGLHGDRDLDAGHLVLFAPS